MYIRHMIHSKTQNLGVADKLCHLELSISSDRLLNLSTNLGNAAIEQLYVHLNFDIAYLQWEE